MSELKQLQCLLIDDETEALDALEMLLEDSGCAKVVGKVNNPAKALSEIEKHSPDVVFLDIDMPQKNGIEVLQEINRAALHPKVVFATAFNQYVLEALRNSAFDYLQKPIDRLELKQVLNRVSNETVSYRDENKAIVEQLEKLDMLKLPVSYGYVFLKKDDIVYLEADGNYTQLILKNGKSEISSKNLGQIEQALDSPLFVRISRSTVININFLSKFNRRSKKCQLYCKNQTHELKVSRSYLSKLEEIFA